MKINVHGGHNFHVTGASGCFSETTEDRKVKDSVITHLRNAGHTVYDCTDETATTKQGNLNNIVAKCNAHTVDLDVSIHFNASNGQGHGTEVWVYPNSTVKSTAQRIVDNIAALGFRNRGVKWAASGVTPFYVLRKTKAPALLIECCFCDNKTDASIYNAYEMAKAIAEGILNKKISEDGATEQTATEEVEMNDELKDFIDQRVKAQLAALTDISGTGDDMPESMKKACEWAKANGIFGGDGAGNYGWNKLLTRAQAAQLFYNRSQKNV